MIDISTLERYRPIISDWDAFSAALAAPLPQCIWTNTLRLRPGELSERLQRRGIEGEPLPWLPYAFRLPQDVELGNQFAYVTGLYHVQEEASLLPVPLLAPEPGERILDLCAAPGNKTAQMAVHMDNRGTLVANDRNEGRQRVLVATLNRMGVINTSATVCDGANFPVENGLFDRVLVDVPCSCEGTSRKNPEVLFFDNETRQSDLQEALLRQAVELCRPGGHIVYSTCTYAPEENEAVVDTILQEYGEERIKLKPARLEGFTSSPGVTAWHGRAFHPSLSTAMRVWPHQNDTGGFFAALLEKIA